MARERLHEAIALASPVMLAYISIGIPCGVMEAEVGFTPLLAFLVSATYYSGAGQFMIPSLWLAGTPLTSIFLSVALVSARQLLYSTAFVPFLPRDEKGASLVFASFVTDETFGINLDRFSARDDWDLSSAMVVNFASMLSWASANAVGAALGSVLDLPLDVMSFGMTAIFICLLLGQIAGSSTIVAAIAAFLGVAACKLVGLDNAAIVVGAAAGIACGLVLGERGDAA